MFFNYTLGLQDLKEETKIIGREAVRAIILNQDSIFMVHTNKGDYKLPGGGVNKKEKHEEALEREVKEETGYLLDSIIEKIGIVIERNVDKYEEDSVFEMVSYYYLCQISDRKTFQQLDDYEAELGFRPIWINIDKAIQENEQILKAETKEKNPWVYREVTVLKAVREYYFIHKRVRDLSID
jgi:8-oxo-dGTP pyrophosphatase MutT (NUDIX family)